MVENKELASIYFPMGNEKKLEYRKRVEEITQLKKYGLSEEEYLALEDIASCVERGLEELVKKKKTKIEEGYVKELDLENYKLAELPKSVGNLRNLKGLYVYNNELTELPREIGKLVNLEKLEVGDNQLTGLPREIGNLVNLVYLDVSVNQLTKLPKGIEKLKNLKGLYVWNNPLNYFSRKLLKKLEKRGVEVY